MSGFCFDTADEDSIEFGEASTGDGDDGADEAAVGLHGDDVAVDELDVVEIGLNFSFSGADAIAFENVEIDFVVVFGVVRADGHWVVEGIDVVAHVTAFHWVAMAVDDDGGFDGGSDDVAVAEVGFEVEGVHAGRVFVNLFWS